MYQLQVNPNASRPSASDVPPAFSPPIYAVWVNSLWFLSLAISLSCAMLATSLQQWARRYRRITQPRRVSPHKRARTRAYFAYGVEKFHVPWAVESLPTLVHLALFSFFAGLLIYLFNINHTVFKVVVCWMALLSTGYGFITFMPVFRHNSPYFSPLSLTTGYLHAVILYTILKVPEIMARYLFTYKVYDHIRDLRFQYQRWITWGVDTVVEAATSRSSSEIDGHILKWTVESLDEDNAIETLIESIPGFYKSDVVKDIPDSTEWTMAFSLGKFLERTLSSNSASSSIKRRRLVSCLNIVSAADLDPFPAGLMFRNLLGVNWQAVPDPIEIGHILKSWDRTTEGRFAPFIRGTIAHIIAAVQGRDDRWATPARDHLAISEAVLRDYLTQGDSLLLANLIHYTRFTERSESFSRDVVKYLSKLDICNTLPRLQHDFCALWNQVVPEAQRGRQRYTTWILAEIRHLYIALHQGTDAAPTAFSESTASYDDILFQSSSYPLCNIPGHLSHPMHHAPETSSAGTALPPPAS
jgi:hypothetical protein